MRIFPSFLSVYLLVSLLSLPPAQATQIIYRSPQQMGKEASLVVRGTVSSVRSFWNDTQTKIFTETTVTIDATHKGQAQRSVRILQLGGSIGNVNVTVHGALNWKRGEEVVLFLEPYDAQYYRVAGFSQGKFTVERDPDTGEPLILYPDLDGVEVIGAPGKDDLSAAGRSVKIPLRQFIDHSLTNGR